MSIFNKTFSDLEAQAKDTPEILISFSGGKDSLIVLDMCHKTFSSVVGFFMYLVPGLNICEAQINYALNRYPGLEIVQYPHWLLSRFLKEGIYCNASFKYDNIPDLRPNDIYAIAREDTGYYTIATGMKKADTMWRRRNMAQETPGVIHPLKDWNKYDVMAYCKIYNIPLPDAAEGNVSGIDLSERTLLWLHEKHHDDFLKLSKLFPFIEVPIYRRAFYGARTGRRKQTRKKS